MTTQKSQQQPQPQQGSKNPQAKPGQSKSPINPGSVPPAGQNKGQSNLKQPDKKAKPLSSVEAHE